MFWMQCRSGLLSVGVIPITITATGQGQSAAEFGAAAPLARAHPKGSPEAERGGGPPSAAHG